MRCWLSCAGADLLRGIAHGSSSWVVRYGCPHSSFYLHHALKDVFGCPLEGSVVRLDVSTSVSVVGRLAAATM